MSKKDEKFDVIVDAKNISNMMRKQLEESVKESFAPTFKAIVDAKLQEAEDNYDDNEEDDDETMQEIFDFGLNEEEEEGSEEESPEHEAGETPEEEAGEHESGEDTPISQLTKGDLQAMITDVVSSLLGDEAGTQDDSEMPDLGSEDGSEDGLDEDAMLETILQEIGVQTPSTQAPNAELTALRHENAQLKEAIKVLKQSLNESLITFAHSKYVNKLAVEKQLSKEQIIKISESFDSMKSVDEIKRAYTLLSESYSKKVEPKKSTSTKTAIKEGIFKNTNPAPKTIIKESTAIDPFKQQINKNLGK